MKQFRILRTHKETTIASALTTRLQILAELKQRLEKQHPDDDFCIVDSLGNPVQIEDFAIANMSAKLRMIQMEGNGGGDYLIVNTSIAPNCN